MEYYIKAIYLTQLKHGFKYWVSSQRSMLYSDFTEKRPDRFNSWHSSSLVSIGDEFGLFMLKYCIKAQDE